jgi:hypothetical protein
MVSVPVVAHATLPAGGAVLKSLAADERRGLAVFDVSLRSGFHRGIFATMRSWWFVRVGVSVVSPRNRRPLATCRQLQELMLHGKRKTMMDAAAEDDYLVDKCQNYSSVFFVDRSMVTITSCFYKLINRQYMCGVDIYRCL